MISYAKRDYIIERIEELRKVYGDYEMQTESIAFIFNDYDDVFICRQVVLSRIMEVEHAEAIIERIVSLIDNNWLEKIRKP